MPSTPAARHLPQDLDASTVMTAGLACEMNYSIADIEKYCPHHVASNLLAPLLAAAAPSLRQLQLTIGEAPDDPMAAALRAATRVNSLALRFRSSDWPPDDAARLDCRLLSAMRQLRRLHVDLGERLEAPAALAALPLLDLTLDCHEALPAIAPHVAGLLYLHLSDSCAADLREAEPAVQALRRLTSLRRLTLAGQAGRVVGYTNAETAAQASKAESGHVAALAALQALLPAGCQVQAKPPFVCLRG